MKRRSSFSLLVFALIPFAPATAQNLAVTREVSVAALHARDADEFTAATRFAFTARQDLNVSALPTAWFADARGVLALEDKANTEGISGHLGAEFYQRYGGSPIAPPPPPPLIPTLTPPPAASTPAPTGLLVGAGFKAGFETDQAWRNNQFTIGPRLSLSHSTTTGVWPLLPSITVAYQRVYAVKAGALQQYGIGDRASWRLDLAANWKWRPFGPTDLAARTPLTPIALAAEVRYSRSHEMSARARALDLDDALYTAGTISYDTRRFNWRYVHDIYVTIAHGRIAPATRNDTTIFLGVSVLQ